ncbi:MAG: UDP-2,3-diacylglucosamine diphosphatase [Pseudomarimonas sp.]
MGSTRNTLGFRTVFVSDVHLGTTDCRADYLLDFLQRTRCETLYLVGDIIDLEALARRSYWPASHTAVLAELIAIAERGTRVIYIPGNHDSAMRGLVGQTLAGIEVRLHADHIGADGRRYRVSHGDEFDVAQLGKRWLMWVGERGHRLLLLANRSLNGLRRRLQMPYLPLSIITKSRLSGALHYIRSFESAVAAAASAGGYEGHICGHIHFGGVRQIGNVLYLNDGDWVEHCTALTEDASGAMELLHWCEHATRLGRASSELLLPSSAAALAFASCCLWT